MFTGIVEEVGTLRNIRRLSKGAALEIEAKRVLTELKVGDSVAVNGVCLTATAFTPVFFTADVMPETMLRSNLGALRLGSRVNLERALTLQSRLGGHLVSGHIDGTGDILEYRRDDNAIWVKIGAADEIMKYVINKGSIAIDGISLTIAEVGQNFFSVSVIPHTQEETTLVHRRPGERVNLENDMIARYVERLLKPGEPAGGTVSSGLSLDFLLDNGF